MPTPPVPPFQIIAAGVCPQGLSAGQRAPNCIGATVIKGSDSIWQAYVNDPTATSSNTALILSPGGGSNLTGGVNFGQSSQSTSNGQLLLTWEVWKTADQTALDVECQFIIVKWPDGEEGGV